MGEIVTIHSEGLVAFIRRIGGVVNTDNIAKRFGWDLEQARRELRALERAGVLAAPTRNVHPTAGCGGSILEWKLRDFGTLPHPGTGDGRVSEESEREDRAVVAGEVAEWLIDHGAPMGLVSELTRFIRLGPSPTPEWETER